jgi:hypothetical protein
MSYITKAQTSPNGKIVLRADKQGSTQFVVTYHSSTAPDQELFTIPLFGVRTTNGAATSYTLQSVSPCRHLSVKYSMKIGKKSLCTNQANEYVYTFLDSSRHTTLVVFRLYNDGVALRYILPDCGNTFVMDESTTFKFPNTAKSWMEKYDGYEGYYNAYITSTQPQTQWGFPALYCTSDSLWTLLTEADITKNHCASHLSNLTDPQSFKVQMAQDSVVARNRWCSPWRLAIIGKLNDVVQSTLVTDVSTPSRIKHPSWVQPGTASWIYWAYNHGSKDFQIVKSYIDMAVTLHMPYVLIDWEWDRMTNGGNVADAVAYARSKNIKPLLWYNSSTTKWSINSSCTPLYRLNTHENRMKEFAWLKQLGIAGIKIDFFDGDGVDMMNYYIDILEDAARFHLLVNFHGATVPRGWQRTYPNLMSTEAVHGAEWYNNGAEFTDNAAAHNATLPFTRNVIGPMDYTPCAFSDSQHPHITTNTHELALTVLFESAIQHLADRPSSYLSQSSSVQNFLSNLPTAWDETRFLSGYPSQSVIMARRKGTTWYLAGINGTNTPQTFTLNLAPFLLHARHITIFTDGATPRTITITTYSTTTSSQLTSPHSFPTLPRGGFVVVFQ